MSFIDQEDIITVMEGLIARVFSEAKGVEVQLPVERLTYAEAIRRFGLDTLPVASRASLTVRAGS